MKIKKEVYETLHKNKQINEYVVGTQALFTTYLYETLIIPKLEEYGQNYKFESAYKLYMSVFKDPEFYNQVKSDIIKLIEKKKKNISNRQKLRDNAYAERESNADSNDIENRFLKYCKKINHLHGIDEEEADGVSKYVPRHKVRQVQGNDFKLGIQKPEQKVASSPLGLPRYIFYTTHVLVIVTVKLYL